MKNLKLTYSSCVAEELLKNAESFCIDSDSGTIYFANRDQLCYLPPDTKKVECRSLNLDIAAEECRLIGMEYILDTQFLCLTFSSGDIATYSISDAAVDLVGCVSSGLAHSLWSPDQELLLVLTGDDTFILLSKEFDPLVEKTLHPQEFGESKPMTVGWGSKETQFHGTEGKAAAKVKAIEPKKALPWDEHKPRSSWRGDGELFATTVIDPHQGCRKIRIWSREGILQYTNEMTDGLEQALFWRPSGNLITCTQQLPNKHKVIFYEKNGLRHGEFTLPYTPNTFVVKEVLWNLDSTILCVWGHHLDSPSNASVTLWTMKNYHWYLKQSLEFNEATNSNIRQITWDPHHASRLHILCHEGRYLCYNWNWSLSRSLKSDEDDAAILAVIDNGSALITPFRRMIVPPPMCAYVVTCSPVINCCVFSVASEDFCLVLSNREIAFFSMTPSEKSFPYPNGYSLALQAAGGNGFRSAVKTHYYLGTYSISWSSDVTLSNYPLAFCNWTWTYDNELICSVANENSTSSLLLAVNLAGKTESLLLNGRCCGEIDGTVVGICSNESGTISAVHLSNGKIMKYEQGKLSSWKYNNKDLVLPCTQISLSTVEDTVVVMGLTDRFGFYCNDSLLLSDCTSYCCHGEFLIITTSDDKVKCYEMKSVSSASKAHGNLSELASQNCERGCRIVASVVGDTKVILQMPRGNLEVIHPRPLVLSAMSKLLDNLLYRQAFDIAKEHRINLNIFYDHNPKKFCDSVAKFVEEIDVPSDLNLFLVSLTNDNVVQTLYPFYNVSCSDMGSNWLKRDVVCDLIRSAISSSKDVYDKYFETIMATCSQRTVPEIDTALMLIKQKRDMRNADSLADKALNFLLLLVDVNELYKVALGTYDFEIAVMVAEKSNMDPKEYLPFLNELQELDENYRKYKIDMHLGRHKKAIENISKCDDHFEECLKLIKEQRLYTYSLDLFHRGSERYTTIWREYGDYLMKKMYYRDSGMAYTVSRDHEKAFKAYAECGDWQLAISALYNLDYTEDQQYKSYIYLVGKLKMQQRHQDAAHILEHYMKNDMEAISTYIAGQCWDSAFLLISRRKDNEMMTTNLKPAISEHSLHLVNWFEDKESEFDRHLARLKFLRLQGDKNHTVLQNGDPEDDLFSETSSMTGVSTQSSRGEKLSGSLITKKSSRSRKKSALKKFRLKEGSPNEDLALMAELSTIISETDKQKDGFYSLLRILVLLDEKPSALTVERKMKKFIAKIELEMPNIWSASKQSEDMVFGPNFTTKDAIELVQMQTKTIHSFTDPEIPRPTWRKNMDIFLQLSVD